MAVVESGQRVPSPAPAVDVESPPPVPRIPAPNDPSPKGNESDIRGSERESNGSSCVLCATEWALVEEDIECDDPLECAGEGGTEVLDWFREEVVDNDDC